MMRRFVFPALILAASAFAQTPAPKLQFEVATIKPAPPMNPAAIAAGKMHVGMSVDGSRVDIGFVALPDLIQAAYKVKQHQVVAPDWAKSQRFDILAKMPEGSNKDQVPEMLQSLLADRFGLTFHKEPREQSVFALVVAKGGHKMKEAPKQEKQEKKEEPAEPKPDPKGTNTINFGGGSIKQSGNSMVVTSKEMSGQMKMTMVEGKMHMEADRMKMEPFADMLTRFVGKPVVDMTELKGEYEAAIDISMAELMNIARAQGMMAPGMMGGGAPAGGDAGRPADAASDPTSGGSIFTSIQALGLKLENRKTPFDTIIVDKLSKEPTEN
jgi:uncharacterized protein (TIGR03435 family)